MRRDNRSLFLAVLTVLIAALMAPHTPLRAAEELPQFAVPGHEAAMKSLNDLHALNHAEARSSCTLWDTWLPYATLWSGNAPRDFYRNVFLKRRIGTDGYVSMQQHRGMGHSEGWPFPGWQQSGGIGFHFSNANEAWAVGYFKLKALTNTDGWEITGARVEGFDPIAGLKLKATADTIILTTPAFRCESHVAPFARLEWAARGLPTTSQPTIAWMKDTEKSWSPERHVTFPSARDAEGMHYSNISMSQHPGYSGVVTRYRVTITHAAGSSIDLKSIITAIDTRHPLTNSNFIRGCTDFFNWTHDVAFLRASIGRMRTALTFALNEFSVREGRHVRVPWAGHDGRSGLVLAANGTKTLRKGTGVGNNYWDLIPFGGHDASATIYLYDSLRGIAELERDIASHPEWQIPSEKESLDPDDIDHLADEVRTDFRTRFWNAAAGRFVGWIDLDGKPYDYGFTVLNLEAVHHGLASSEQALSILSWLDGKRDIAGDTSRGDDIYHWRFAARATTKRNIESYVWAWSSPERITWGNQVQDGGSVLGFGYYDMMARLKTNGPDDAWKRLSTILGWFGEVQKEGGYRAYYAKPGRGTLQGGGPPGGLGMDKEFMESVLVPQVMLYGFLGFTPTADGFDVKPNLPRDWPSLTVTGIHIHDHIINITADSDGHVQIKTVTPGKVGLHIGKGPQAIALISTTAGTITEMH
ncbi:MAG: hypothetical protein WCT04_19950 [Planctomycetota bacterium]